MYNFYAIYFFSFSSFFVTFSGCGKRNRYPLMFFFPLGGIYDVLNFNRFFHHLMMDVFAGLIFAPNIALLTIEATINLFCASVSFFYL
jgi:hypothetical protein